MMKHERILKFIDKFTKDGRLEEVIECFTQGCCYWFAFILLHRFGEKEGRLMYDGVWGHFGYKNIITNRVYDITGDVTDSYDWNDWLDDYINQDTLRSNRITKNCIEME